MRTVLFVLVVLLNLAGCGPFDPVYDSPPSVTTPTLQTGTPTGSAVALNTPIVLTFNKAMNCATIMGGGVTLSPSLGGTWACSGLIATFTPVGQSYSTTYTVKVTTAITDSAGKNLSAAVSWSYSTTTDVTAPTLQTGTPTGSAVALNAPITLIFNKEMNCATITGGGVKFFPSLDGAWLCAGSTAVFYPTGQSYSTTYTVKVTTAITDSEGKNLSVAVSWSYSVMSTTAPEGAWFSKQTIRQDSPPAGYSAVVIWAQTATMTATQQTTEKAFVTIDYWKFVETSADGVGRVIYQENYDYPYKTFNTNEMGLYQRTPTWFGVDTHYTAFNAYASNGYMYIDVSQAPNNIVHWWTDRKNLVTGAKYSVEARFKVEGKAAVQFGSDWWRSLDAVFIPWQPDCTKINSCEAWLSDWYGDTNGQFVVINAPIR